jgi:hypothetical protein
MVEGLIADKALDADTLKIALNNSSNFFEKRI